MHRDATVKTLNGHWLVINNQCGILLQMFTPKPSIHKVVYHSLRGLLHQSNDLDCSGHIPSNTIESQIYLRTLRIRPDVHLESPVVRRRFDTTHTGPKRRTVSSKHCCVWGVRHAQHSKSCKFNSPSFVLAVVLVTPL